MEAKNLRKIIKVLNTKNPLNLSIRTQNKMPLKTIIISSSHHTQAPITKTRNLISTKDALSFKPAKTSINQKISFPFKLRAETDPQNKLNTKSKETPHHPNQFLDPRNHIPRENKKSATQVEAHQAHHQIQAVLRLHRLEEAQVHHRADQVHLQILEVCRASHESMRERSTRIFIRRRTIIRGRDFTNRRTINLTIEIGHTISTTSHLLLVKMRLM